MEKSPAPENDSDEIKDAVASPHSPTVDASPPEVLQEPPEAEENEVVEDSNAEEPDLTLPQVWEEIDAFLGRNSDSPRDGGESNSDSDPIEIPRAVELLSKNVESMIDKYALDAGRSKFGHDPEEDSCFFGSVGRLSKLADKIGDLKPTAENANVLRSSSLNRTSSVLQQAMSFLEEEFRAILDEDSKTGRDDSDPKSAKTKHSSSFNNCCSQESDRCNLPEPEPPSTEEEFQQFTPETISVMSKIADAMICAGYETECCVLWMMMRRRAFKSALSERGFDVLSIDDVQRMQWDSLEREIATWIAAVKRCSTILIPGEGALSGSVFSGQPEIAQDLYGNLARSVSIRLLDFAEAVVLTQRSAEKLFKFLDMYETLQDLIAAVDGSKQYPDDPKKKEVRAEMMAVKGRIGEAAVSIFCQLESSIKSDSSKVPVPSGAVHPLTRYTMNYLEYACEYKDTLEQVFQQHHDKAVVETANGEPTDDADSSAMKASPFSVQLLTVMDLLDANLDMKSKLYKDPSLRYIFLMNNGRYIVQKIKGSSKIHELMGDTWCRRRSSDLRQYHKNYQRETWYRLLQCLNHEGLQVNGKVSKPVLKERFKSFNAMFDDIHKTQSTWVVNDEQLQSELRVSISAVVTPAYRSFLGRFNQYLDPGRQSEKYIKYQPEDIESLVDELFDGNPTSMGRRRT
ncbi:exocyst complex component EXO70B1 [Rhodamnia argentea]|uniref:Exocyst subunit Exo70 family protein n=1 Tax=Rhodamnia argentea TaxID=178133 RepID=A0A8B8Q6E6_9MYRT|nr:exocyst complex component EXO70B1 [Rhodamnia argentea]